MTHCGPILQLFYVFLGLYCVVTLNRNDFLKPFGALQFSADAQNDTEPGYDSVPTSGGFTSAANSASFQQTSTSSSSSTCQAEVHQLQHSTISLFSSAIQSNVRKFHRLLSVVKEAFTSLWSTLRRVFSFSSGLPFIASEQQGKEKVIEVPSQLFHWGEKPVTEKEKKQIEQLRAEWTTLLPSTQSIWAKSIHDVDILRFLRGKNHHVGHALKALQAHDKWRVSEFGAESTFTQKAFPTTTSADQSLTPLGAPPNMHLEESRQGTQQISPLRYEGFWLGEDHSGCPTLVIRTQVHDGIYYNDDPRIYTAFIVRLIEEGRQRFGVGVTSQMCVLMDRGGQVYRNTEKKKEKLDMSVIPALLELFRHLYSTIVEQYPELMSRARIAPASWFFSMCYKITSTVMAPSHRERFMMLKERDIPSKLHNVLSPSVLPVHLGGHDATHYASEIRVPFDSARSYYPIDGSYRRKHKAATPVAPSLVPSDKINDEGGGRE